MNRIVTLLLALIATLATPSLAGAADTAGVVQLQAAPTALRPDSAYLLLKLSTAKSGIFAIQPVLVRIPSASEMDAYRAAKQTAYEAAVPKLTQKAKGGPVPTIDAFEFDYAGPANSFVVRAAKFLEDGEMRTILLEVPPGTYVLYGSTLQVNVVTCNCLGTVKFTARAGVITHVGSIYVDKVHKVSPLPHLEDNLGPQMFEYGFIFGEALVPADAATPIPVSLQGLAVEPAHFDVVGEYYEPGAGSINRLAPIPGLLAYDRGRVIDVRTGKAAE